MKGRQFTSLVTIQACKKELWVAVQKIQKISIVTAFCQLVIKDYPDCVEAKLIAEQMSQNQKHQRWDQCLNMKIG